MLTYFQSSSNAMYANVCRDNSRYGGNIGMSDIIYIESEIDG